MHVSCKGGFHHLIMFRLNSASSSVHKNVFFFLILASGMFAFVGQEMTIVYYVMKNV